MASLDAPYGEIGCGRSVSSLGGSWSPAAALDDAKTKRRTPTSRAASSSPTDHATLASKVPSGSRTESSIPARAARWTIAWTRSTAARTAFGSASEARISSWGTSAR
jgi:hypothetical protein